MPGQFQPPANPAPTIPGQNTQANGQPGQPQAGQLPPAPNAPATPYDFFLDQPKPSAPVNPLPVNGKRMGNPTTPMVSDKDKKKFVLVAAGAIGLVIIIMVITSLIPKDQTGPQLFGVAQTQQEIIRVCSDGMRKAKQRATRNFAVTCTTGVASSQKELLAYISAQGYEVELKQIDAKASSKTDAQLKSAASSSNYDNTFRDLVESQLTAYNSSLTGQLGISDGDKIRAVLSKAQTSNELLIKMVKDKSDTTETAVEGEE